MKLNDLMFRGWYYLQLGWQVYLSIIFALVNFITITYSFIIKNYSFFADIFPNHLWFGIMTITMIFPSATLAGYLHFRSRAKKAEVDISYQVNPYFARRMVNTEMILKTYVIIGKLLIQTKKPAGSAYESNLIHEIQAMKNFMQSRTITNKLDMKYIKTETQERGGN